MCPAIKLINNFLSYETLVHPIILSKILNYTCHQKIFPVLEYSDIYKKTQENTFLLGHHSVDFNHMKK